MLTIYMDERGCIEIDEKEGGYLAYSLDSMECRRYDRIYDAYRFLGLKEEPSIEKVLIDARKMSEEMSSKGLEKSLIFFRLYNVVTARIPLMPCTQVKEMVTYLMK